MESLEIEVLPAEIVKLEELTAGCVSLLADAQNVQISTDEKASQLADTSAKLAKAEKQAELIRKETVAPLNAKVKKINTYVKGLLNPLQEARRIINQKLLTYQSDQARAKEDQKRKALLDTAKGIEKNEKGLFDFAALAKTDAAKQYTENQKLVSSRKVWVFEIVEPDKVDKKYCEPSRSKIAEAVKAGKRKISGVKIYQKESAVLRK